MSGKHRLNARLEAAAKLRDAGQFKQAHGILEALKSDPEIGLQGPLTSFGLPRRLHSALLKLAKAEGDGLRRIGYQYHLVPPPERLAHFTEFTTAERRDIAQANRQSVPRVIHQIWIGDLPVPSEVKAWARHASAHGYEHKLWRETELNGLGLSQNPVYVDMLANRDYPGAVDVARYVILHKQGGIYLDCDWFPARNDISFHDILPMMGLTAMAEDIPRNTGKGALLLANSMIIAPPNHPVLARLNATIGDITQEIPNAPAWWSTGPLIFSLMCRGGSVTLADAALVEGKAGSLGEVTALCQRAVAKDGGLLIAWKSW